MNRLWQHLRRIWPRYTLVPGLAFWLYALAFALAGKLRWDHIATAVFVSIIAYATPWTKRLFLGLLPIGLVGFLYDSMRFVKNFGLNPERVHICDLRAAELWLFGFQSHGVRVTLSDWFQQHASLALDLLCAIPYGTFIYFLTGYAIYLYFKDFRAQQRFTWCFLLLNVAGFVTYHLYPAAPPWYFHHYGCVADLSVMPNEGPNLARVDAFLGIEYFRSMYGRSSDIFGAVPSLHVAYPLFMLLDGWSRHRALGRSLLALFYFSMCFSASYLDHHWLIDIVLGSLYAVLAGLLLRKLDRLTRARHSESPALGIAE